jgi:death-on-curing protein
LTSLGNCSVTVRPLLNEFGKAFRRTMANGSASKTGEPHALRDPPLLESAIDKPRNHFAYDGQEDVATLAATLLFGIAENHPFVQGNKRTALVCAIRFLECNGFTVSAPDTEALGKQVLAVIKYELSLADFALKLRSCLTEVEET